MPWMAGIASRRLLHVCCSCSSRSRVGRRTHLLCCCAQSVVRTSWPGSCQAYAAAPALCIIYGWPVAGEQAAALCVDVVVCTPSQRRHHRPLANRCCCCCCCCRWNFNRSSQRALACSIVTWPRSTSQHDLPACLPIAAATSPSDGDTSDR